MFGHLRAKREKEKFDKERKGFANERKEWESGASSREKKASDLQNKEAIRKAAQSKAERRGAREEGRAETEAFLRKDYSGLGIHPEARQAMQFEANKGIQRGHQAANRKLLGEHAQHGIRGQGGVGYAQQRDLQRLSSEAQAGVHRDLSKLDKDLELKKIAAIFSGGEGHAAQGQLDKQLAIDELQFAEEKRKAKKYEDKFNHAFSRI